MIIEYEGIKPNNRCVIEDRCLMGISATVLSRAVVKVGSIVAAGSVVIEKQQIGPYHLVTGVPAKIKNRFEKKVRRRFASIRKELSKSCRSSHGNLSAS